jgi:rhodanese-related sulfurtransferase
MNLSLSRLSTNARLGLLLGLLGAGALLIGDPGRGASASIDPEELARLVQTETDHVSVEELADWIIQGKSDFRLVDLRSEAEFARYHIPGAENILITGLLDAGLLRNEKIVLYSEGGIHSAQAWFLLKAKGYQGVYLLRGGLEQWNTTILFPRIPESPTADESALFEKMKNVSTFFGGKPLSGAPADDAAMTMPAIEMPAASAGGAGGPAVAKKKKKEGC